MFNIVTDWQKCELIVEGKKVVDGKAVRDETRDKVFTCELKRLSSKDYLSLWPIVSNAEMDGIERGIKIQEMSKDILTNYVQNIEGFTVDGAAPTIEQLTTKTVLCSFVGVIILKLMEISTLTENEEKN
jgi:hypothetical protein